MMLKPTHTQSTKPNCMSIYFLAGDLSIGYTFLQSLSHVSETPRIGGLIVYSRSGNSVSLSVYPVG